MKKTYLYTHICPLLFIMAFITSCSGQEKSNLSKDNQLTNEPLSTPDAHFDSQIAEYVRHIFQDKNGNLWFGTNDYGVAHFNGDSLSYFSNGQGFSGTQITGMTEDQERNLWFATDQGIVKYDWSTTENGEKIFTNFTDHKVFKGKYVWSIFSDSKGTIWAGTSKGVSRFDGTKLEPFELPYSDQEETDGFITNRTIWSIMEDKKGNLWFGTNGNGAFKYDGKTFTQYTEKDGLTDNSVDKIYEDKVGNIWFSSEGFGVYRYNGESFTNFYKKQGLGVKAVQTIFEDKEGRFWVGGGGGLYRYDGKSFFIVTKNCTEY